MRLADIPLASGAQRHRPTTAPFDAIGDAVGHDDTRVEAVLSDRTGIPADLAGGRIDPPDLAGCAEDDIRLPPFAGRGDR